MHVYGFSSISICRRTFFHFIGCSLPNLLQHPQRHITQDLLHGKREVKGIMQVVEVIFWISVGFVFYSFVGFPILLALRALFFRKPVKRGATTPTISVIIAAHNEGAIIRKKLDNVFALKYPRHFLEVVVASDGSEDETEHQVRQYPSTQIKLLALPRRGKNYALSAAVEKATGEILVFTDADTMMAANSLQYLIAPFSDRDVGAVGGDYRYEKNGMEVEGERTYWSYDRWIKLIQTAAGSMTSATGQIYALRRKLFAEIPFGVTDDCFESIQAPAHKKRLIFEPEAIAYGPITDSAQIEFHRKVRNVANGLSSVWKMKRLLNPFRYGFYSLQLFSHKVLRRLVAFPLFAMFVCSLILWPHGFIYQSIALAQIFVYGLGLTYPLAARTGSKLLKKIVALPFFFELVNAAAVVAIAKLLFRKQQDIWRPYRPVMNKYATASAQSEISRTE
ncbi:MAG: hypothetical protein C5B54_04630 [Acidobacteria bacterium]|nr:MAG: hypothetical protein C5B54_04630 [Acidobacteriota bacterium]